MGKAIRASALILLLTCTAQAGWMGNETPAPPPQPLTAQYITNDSPAAPQTASAVDETTANGWAGYDVAANLKQAALDLLAVLPSLL